MIYVNRWNERDCGPHHSWNGANGPLDYSVRLTQTACSDTVQGLRPEAAYGFMHVHFLYFDMLPTMKEMFAREM